MRGVRAGSSLRSSWWSWRLPHKASGHVARADLANANANYELARSTADRWTEMLKSKSVSKQETDEKVGDMLAKKATLDAARFNVAQLEKTQSFQKVYAPFDGTVTARNVDVGALIDAGSASGPAKELFHVAQADRLRVYVNVPQAYAQQVRAQQTAFLTLTETPSKRYPGVVARTAGAVDQQQCTMLVEVDVENRNGDLLPGAYAQVHFALGANAASFTLPGNAFLFLPDGVKVATVDPQHKVKLVLKLVPVSLGTDFGTRVAVASGLHGDEQVILNPQDSIVDGAPVRIVTPKAGKLRGRRVRSVRRRLTRQLKTWRACVQCRRRCEEREANLAGGYVAVVRVGIDNGFGMAALVRLRAARRVHSRTGLREAHRDHCRHLQGTRRQRLETHTTCRHRPTRRMVERLRRPVARCARTAGREREPERAGRRSALSRRARNRHAISLELFPGGQREWRLLARMLFVERAA
ncbi:MAG: RND efflux system, membrane fusion protein [uncultured Paraburkholderia sp.]|nr:MAG: RND efflux system, membrane fusion protein [uncultured Paraburkholderia sp.]CAH2942169.1 MAG: RND efflux system, membrane fusion protein [uncultured Paraburkholderia sp.]